MDPVFLLKAVKEKEIIDLGFKKKEKMYNFGSRFLKLHSDRQSIIIESPSIRGVYYKVLKKEDPVSVIFQTSGFHFRFKSRVIEKTNYTSGQGGSLPALRIYWPEILSDHNRRSFFRLAVHPSKSLKVKYLVSGSENSSRKKKENKDKSYNSIEALMMDISEAGMAVQLKPKTKIRVNDRMKIYFCYEENNSEIELNCVVRNIRNSKDNKKQFCGLQFIKDQNRDHKKSIQKILRYIISRDADEIQFLDYNKIVSRNLLVQKIADGEVKHDVIEMLLSKQFNLSEIEYFEALVFITKIEKFKKQAQSLLETINSSVKIEYCKKEEANHQVIRYVLDEALKKSESEIIRAIVNNQNFPVHFLLKIARQGTRSMLEMLMVNKIRFQEYPEIFEVMKKNSVLNGFLEKKILDLQQYWLKYHKAENISEIEVKKEIERLSEKKTEAKDTRSAKSSRIQRKKRIFESLKKINKMSVPERAKLALVGDDIERLILTKDPYDVVVSALIENPNLNEGERVSILKNRKIGAMVVEKVVQKNDWLINNDMIRLLLKNPHLPTNKILFILSRIKMSDLLKIINDESINPGIRKIASGLYSQENK